MTARDGMARARRRAVAIGIALAAALLVQGCVEIRMRVGARPDVTVLETKLEMRRSTRDDVRALLGTPFGEGAAMLPFHDSPRDMWSYYYEEGTLKDDRRMFLFVYFTADERYDGYMWFSSLPK